MSTTPSKDTIYVDVEDEITSIIDKIKGSDAKVVALVLPKRSTALQSIVNLKLLHRTAKTSKKNLVLVTSDSTVLPLAGAVGLHVAKTAQSKPVIPPAPHTSGEPDTSDLDESADLDKTESIGKLAGDDDTIEIDNDSPKPGPKTDKKSALGAAGAKLKIPNFEKFRTRLFVGGGIFLALVIFWIFATFVWPRATIIVKTDTSVVNTRLNFVGKTDAESIDLEKNTAPIIKQEVEKTSTEKVAATGERNDGKKATGTMTLTNCIDDGNSYTVPAGTGFTSEGKTFITNTSVTLAPALTSGGECKSAEFGLSKNVGVTAVNAGDNYNLSSRSYGVPAAYNKPQGSIQASGSAMTGGTTKITKVVSQQDIDNAKQAALDKTKEEATEELAQQMEEAQAVAINDTFSEGKPETTATPKVNEPASEVTVEVKITYSQLGVKKSDLTQLIEQEVKKHIDTSKQQIQNSGVDEAVVRITAKPSKTEYKLELEAVAVAGPQLDAEGIKNEIAGKKKGPTIDTIKARPGVQDVEIHYSPFWVSSTPSRTSRINIVFNQNNVDVSN